MTPLIWLSALPLFLALFAATVKNLTTVRRVAGVGSVLQFAVTVRIAFQAWSGYVADATIPWFRIDGMAAWFLVVNAIVYLAAMVSAAQNLDRPEESHLSPNAARFLFVLTNLFLICGNVVVSAADLGTLWVAVEATTLVTAPLILLTGTRHSIEASWKYIILCGVGLAFALFGTILIHVASANAGGNLSFEWLIAHAGSLKTSLLDVASVFLVLGYGTKAGLFPVHNWLPDAHSEAPAPASAILSGALLNVAILAIWRVGSIASASETSRLLMILLAPMGTITVLAASIMLIRQHSLKRMWAYSSMENMGVLAIAVAFNLAPLVALHAMAHSLSKCAAFLLSGNVVKGFDTVSFGKLSALGQRAPNLGLALLAAGIAAMGAPPFGSFITEWLIVARVVEKGSLLVALAMVAGFAVSFVAVMVHLGKVVFGEKSGPAVTARPVGSIGPSVVLLLVSGLLFILVSPTAMEWFDYILGVIPQ